jgi:hypothetical protein
MLMLMLMILTLRVRHLGAHTPNGQVRREMKV